MAQTQNPFKLMENLHLRHTPSAFKRIGTCGFRLLRILRTVITTMRFLSHTFPFAGKLIHLYNPNMDGVFTVFTLLSALRRGIAPAQLWHVFRDLGQPLRPRTSFWLALCKQAHLLNQHQHPTAFVKEWLTWQADAQISHLLKAWELVPGNRQERMQRKRLRWRLAQGKEVLPSDCKALRGLDALGITKDDVLTHFGKAVLGQAAFQKPNPSGTWWIENGMLQIPHQPNWLLVWQLESFLSPSASQTYSLSVKSLRWAVQRGDPETLIEILKKGLNAALPAEIRACILGQPTLQVTTGLVLEFSDPTELLHLRRAEPLRSHFEQILSPRHVLVNENNAARLLKMLERRGIYAATLPMSDVEIPKRTHFSRATLLEPLGEKIHIRAFLQKSIHQQLAFEMLYNAPDAQRPEIHRVTPLLIEERAGYTYVVAYSHTRKGQRTYRLDRMEVPGTLPC